MTKLLFKAIQNGTIKTRHDLGLPESPQKMVADTDRSFHPIDQSLDYTG